MDLSQKQIAYYHLPGLFEFYELYRVFLPLFREHREYFYDWCRIGSVYGAPADCLWGGGRTSYGDQDSEKVLALMREYGISARLTFSNSLLKEEHLSDPRCNTLCRLFAENNVMENLENHDAQKNSSIGNGSVRNGIIIYSDLLLHYLQKQYPSFYFVSSTTKVLTDFRDLLQEVSREEFCYVVPDFRLNKQFDQWHTLTAEQKDKIEFLCNECCWFGCKNRKSCYETVSRKNLGEDIPDYPCASPDATEGYRFSKAMENPGFIGIDDIKNVYLPMGFSNFKIEGRGLGSAMLLEFLLYYMTKSEYQLKVREAVYLDAMLDLF